MKINIKSINNRYIIQGELGKGGMGVVHYAIDKLTGDSIAIKQINMPGESSSWMPDTQSMVQSALRLALAHEFQTLASLRHPNIISVLDYGFTEHGQPFFTMPYLSTARTILDAAQNQPLRVQIDLLQQMLQALVYLHRRHILHRDLKPDNVLYTLIANLN